MAVFSYVGGSVSISTGGYGNLAVKKGTQIAEPNTITASARSFVEGTPASTLFNPVDRSYLYSRITFTAGFSANKLNFNTTEPYNNGAYSNSAYYTPYNTVFNDLDYSDYNTTNPQGEYWAHAYGYTNSEFGTAIAVDKERNAWVLGSTDFSGCTITNIGASLTAVGSFTNNATTPTSGTNDSGYFSPWTLPFQHNVFRMNQTSSVLAVMTNSWITFDAAVNTTLATFSGTSPNWANLQIAAGQNSCQRVYWDTFGTAPNRTFRIRFEGTNATTGTLGSPNIVWEFILYESNPNIFDIQTGTITPPATSFSGISAGNGYYGTFTPASNSGYRFNTLGVHQGAAANNITLVRYNTKGQFQRAKDFPPYTGSDDLSVLSIGRNGPDVGESIKVGSDGRIYILYTSASIGFINGVASNDFGILKIDPKVYFIESSGATAGTIWAKTFGTTSADSGQSIDIDSQDNLYVTGFTAGSGQGSNDVFVFKIDKNANVLWRRTYGAALGDVGSAIKASPDGSIYVWGFSTSTPLVGTADYFLLKINGSTGALVWQKHFNIAANTNAQTFENSIDVDPFGNVYVNGYSGTNPDGYFVAKVDSDGNFKWSRNVGAISSNPDAGTSIKYKHGFVFVAGQDSSNDTTDGVGLGVAKLNADTGQLISNYVVGGISTEYAFAMDIDDYGDIYATGAVNTSMTGLTSATGVNALVAKFIVDTPQGGFTVSGDAGVWSSTTAKRYTTSQQVFTPENIVFQNDLIATGQQFIFVGTTSETQTKFEKEFRFSGSGSLPALTSTLEQIPIQTTQYLQRTNVLSDSTEYFRTNFSSLLQVSNVVNPITGVLETPSRIYNGVASSGGGVFPAYLTPVSNTGVFASNTKVVLSIFAKANNFNKFRLLAYADRFGSSGALPDISVEFNLTTGVATNIQATNAPLAYGIIPYADGWYRCYFIVNLRVSSDQSGGAGWFQIRYTPDSVTGSSVYFYGPQVQKDVLTSYVENTSSVSSLTTTAYIEDDNVNTESTFDTPVTTPSTQLFTLSGTPTITYKNALNKPVQTYSGSSDLSLLNGYEVAFDPDLYTGKVQYRVYDSILYSTEKFEKEFTFAGSGFIASSGINVIADVTFKGGVGAPSTQLFTIGSGYTSVKSIDVWSTQDPKVITVSGNVSVKAPNRHIGSSPIEYYPPSQVVLGNEENFRASEIKTDATAFYRFQKGAFSATGSIASGDTAFKSTTNVAFIPLNTLLLFNTNVFTKLAMRYAGKSPTTPFGGLDIIFEELEANAPPQQFKYSGAASEPTKAFKWIGGPQQVSSITGTAVEKNTEAYAVSGQLTTGLEASAKVIFRPFDATDSEQLFSINGQHGTRVFVPNWIPTGRFVSQSGVNEAILKKSSAWVGSSPIQYFDPQEVIFEDGENFRASEFKYESTALYRFQKGTFSGTGSIVGDPNATAAVVFNPPDTAAGIQLFSISGEYSNLRFTKKSSEASGNISIAGAATPPLANYVWVGASPTEYYNAGQIVFGEGENFRASEFKYDSTSLYRFQNGTFNGTGSKQISSAQNIFERSERFDVWWNGFGLTSRSRVQNIEPPLGLTYVTKIVESLDGANAYHGVSRGSGIKFVAGTTYTISIFAKAAERSQLIFGFDPPAFTTNFEYGIFDLNTGTAAAFNPAAGNPTVSIIPYPNGWYRCSVTKTCTTTSSSNALSFQIINNSSNFYTGDGTSGLYITGAQLDEHDSFSPYVLTDGAPVNRVTFKSVSFNPPDEAAGVQLFSVTGSYSDLRSTSRNVITAAPLFTGGSGSAVVVFNPPDTSAETQLFTVTGSLVEKYTKGLYTGDGYINSSDFGSAKVTFRPFDATDSDPLFSINGQHGTRVFVPNWITTGQFVSQDGVNKAVLKQSSAWVGSSPVEYYSAGQIAFGEGENFYASEFKYDSTALYRFQNASFNGSGSITTDPNASAAVVFNPPDEAAGVQLFNVTGAYSDLRFIKKVPADAVLLTVVISGAVSQPTTNYSWVGSSPAAYFNPDDIVFGEDEDGIPTEYRNTATAIYRNQFVESGSGTLFSASGASQSVGANPPDDVSLFNINGSYSDLRSTFDPAPFTGTINITGAATEPTREFSWVGSSPTAYFNPDDIVFGEDEDGIPTEYRNTSTGLYRTQITETGSGELIILPITYTINIPYPQVVFVPTPESATYNPPEFDPLFTISGTYSNFQFISQAGEAPVLFQISGAATQIKSGYAWVGLSPFTYFSAGQIVFEEGENFGASEFEYDSTAAYRFQNATFSGSGSITADPNASAAVVFNPPDTSAETQLFTVSGQHGTRVFVPNWIATGSTTLSGSGSQSIQYANFIGNSPSAYIDPYEVVFGEEENYGSTEIALSGYATFNTKPRGEVGSGALFTDGFFSNLKAIFRPFDATDSEQLFSINGQHGTRVFVPNWIATGSISTGFEGSAKVTFNPPEFDPLFAISGAAVDKHIDVASGSGNLFTASGGAQKVTFRPVDATDTDFLFSISGSAGVKLRDYVWVSAVVEYDPYEYVINDEFIIPDFIKIKTTFEWDNVNNIYRSLTKESITVDQDASGFASVAGNVGTRTFVPNWRGSGSVSVTGAATEKHIDAASGSGNLFAASGASQSVGVNPPDDTALFVVSGTVVEKHIDITSGSGTTTIAGIAVESHTDIALPGSGEAVFGDGSPVAQVIRYVAPTGFITFSQSATASVTFNPPEADPLFIVSGSATDSQTDITSGSGSIATDISAVSRVVFNPADTEQLFEVTGAYSDLKFTSDYNASGTIAVSGTVVEKHIDVASGSGTTTFTGAATESQTDIAVPGTGTIEIDGASVDEYASGGLRGSGTLFIIDGGSARVTFNPPEGNQLFDVSGSFSDIKITSDYEASGSATLEGTLGSRIFVPNWIGSGTIEVTGESTQSHVDITSGSGALFTDGFYSNLKATFRSVSDVGLFDVTGTVVEKHIDAATGSGSTTFTGAATESQTEITSGSGTLFSGGFYSNLRVTFNPTEEPALFDITGFATDKQTYKETGSGSVTLTGTLVEKHIDAATGSGSIATGFNASASVTFRPFDATDTDSLFSILGSAIEKNTESYVGSGDATFSGTAAESQRNITSGSGALFTDGFFSNLKATFRPFDATDLDPLFSINGSAVEKNTESYVGTGSGVFTGDVIQKHIDIASGSGTLFSASGAAEAIGINPPDDTVLFDISGAASERYFARIIGSGSISTAFGGTASVTFNPPEGIQLFTVSGSYSNLKFISANVVSGSATFSGTAVEKHIDVAIGSGSATFDGTAVEKQTDITSGSGSLFTASGASESVGVNPPDDTALFAVSGTYSNLKFISANTVSGSATFSGTVVEKFTSANSVSGTTTFSGTSVEKQTDITSGSGSLFAASGASQSVGANPPEDTSLFGVSGTYSNLKYTSAWVGTGTLFTVSGAAERVTFNPPDDTQLFVVTGAVLQAQTNIALPGSGSLFSAFGGTASVTFNPPEDIQLFDVSGTYRDLKFISANVASGSATFSGTVVEKFASANVVSGTAEFSGTAVESQTDITSGSGSLFAASGAAEAFGANPPEDTALFDISGTYSDLKSTSAYVGSGSLFTFSGAVVVATISEIGTGLFDIGDTAIESTTYKTIDGTGSLFGFAGGVESVTFNPVENTQLFQVSGEVYVTTSFGYGGGVLEIAGSGEAIFRRALVPQFGSGEILSSGESANKKIFAPFVGSGSLFAASGSAQATTNVPPIDPVIWEDDLRTTLYLVSGSASVSRTASIDNDVTINISGSGIARTVLPERVFATII